jgi:hypothetical protein
MRQFQDEGLDFEVLGLNVCFVLLGLLFRLIQQRLKQCRHLCFGGSIKIQVIQLLTYFHGIILPQNTSLAIINTGFQAIFQPSKMPLIRPVNEQAAAPINVANPPRQSATPPPIA